MIHPSDLFELTPGARAAVRGKVGSRPGQPDYMQMQLVEISNYLQRSPLVRSLYGSDVEITCGMVDGETLRFDIRHAPPA